MSCTIWEIGCRKHLERSPHLDDETHSLWKRASHFFDGAFLLFVAMSELAAARACSYHYLQFFKVNTSAVINYKTLFLHPSRSLSFQQGALCIHCDQNDCSSRLSPLNWLGRLALANVNWERLDLSCARWISEISLWSSQGTASCLFTVLHCSLMRVFSSGRLCQQHF